MERTKLTVRVDRKALERAKAYAAQRRTSLSRLISDYLELLGAEERQVPETPILKKLAGILPLETSRDEHRAHLEAKYGQKD